jgi:hypothetical protein
MSSAFVPFFAFFLKNFRRRRFTEKKRGKPGNYPQNSGIAGYDRRLRTITVFLRQACSDPSERPPEPGKASG